MNLLTQVLACPAFPGVAVTAAAGLFAVVYLTLDAIKTARAARPYRQRR